MALNIVNKQEGDELTAEEFNSVVQEINSNAQNIDSVVASIESETNTENNTVNLTLKNKAGEQIGDVISLPLGSGGGGGTTTNAKLTVNVQGATSVNRLLGKDLSLSYTVISTLDGESEPECTATYYVTKDYKAIGATEEIVATAIPSVTQLNTFDFTGFLSSEAGKIDKIRISVTNPNTNLTSTRSIYVTNASAFITLDYSINKINRSALTAYATVQYVGSNPKIHYKVDNVELGTTIPTSSNSQKSFTIPVQTAGIHTLEVWLTLAGDTIESEHKKKEMIWVDANTTQLIAVELPESLIRYEVAPIKYAIYNGTSQTAVVTKQIIEDGVVSSQFQSTDTTEIVNTWNYKIQKSGANKIKFVCGSANRTIEFTASDSDITWESVNDNLSLFLSALNRTNSDTNKDSWNYGDITSQFTNVDFSENGWQDSTHLHLSGDARLTINHTPFYVSSGASLVSRGRTIKARIKTSNIATQDAVVTSCWDGNTGFYITPTSIVMKAGNTLSAKFKDNEEVEVGFTIQPVTDSQGNETNRILKLYIDGEAVSATVYSVDEINQTSALPISLGSNDCSIDIYNIRVYDSCLSDIQMLWNYVMDLDDSNKMMDLFASNQTYSLVNNEAEIDINKQKLQGDVLIVTDIMTGIFSTKTEHWGDVTYLCKENPSRSWKAVNCSIKVQGTTSAAEPVKNLKFTFKDSTILYFLINGEWVEQTTKKWAIREGGIGAKVLCMKTDYNESSGVHNTGLAKFIDSAMKKLAGYVKNGNMPYQDLLIPAQVTDPRIRNTIDGIPCVLFHDVNGVQTFAGKVNLNYDKSSMDVFGLTGDAQSIEFRDNNSEVCNFYASDISGAVDNGNLEFRYPDGGSDVTELQTFYDFLYNCNPSNLGFQCTNGVVASGSLTIDGVTVTDTAENRKLKFKTELKYHAVVNNLVLTIIITELFLMVDQRAKNQFITHFGETFTGKVFKLWRFLFYDNDTALGITNNGLIGFNFTREYSDASVYNDGYNDGTSTKQSLLWSMINDCFKDEIKTMYQDLVACNALNYADIYSVLDDNHCQKWSESIYNADGRYKYLPRETDASGASISISNKYDRLQGSRSAHRKWFLNGRLYYLGGKYLAAPYVNEVIALRLGSGIGSAVTPEYKTSFTSYERNYVTYRLSDTYCESKRLEAWQTGSVATEIESSVPSGSEETAMYIYGARYLRTIGDLSKFYVKSVTDWSTATHLKELILGSDAEGYINSALTSIGVTKTWEQCELINVRNCTYLGGVFNEPTSSGAINLKWFPNLKHFLAKGCERLSGVTLPATNRLETLELPANLTSLTIKNQINITDFSIQGASKLTSVIVENSSIDAFDLLSKCSNISRLRFVNIDGSCKSDDAIKLLNYGGYDENNNVTELPYISGTLTITNAIKISDLESLRKKFSDLKIISEYIIVEFEDSIVAKICLNNFDYDGDGLITTKDLSQVTGIGSLFKNCGMTKFNEFKYFTGIVDGGSSTFDNNSSLKEITFPENIEILGSSMFSYCYSLTTIHWPENCKIKNIGSCFGQCTSLKELIIPDSVTNFTQYLINGCSSLEKLVIGSGMSAITKGFCSNQGLTMLRSVVFNNTKISSLDTVFNGCPNLIELKLPESVTYFAGPILFNCESIENFEFPPYLTQTYSYTVNIYNYVIVKNTHIKELVYPVRMTHINKGACDNIYLDTIVSLSPTPPILRNDAFTGNSDDLKIYVPDLCVDLYKKATNWSLFADRIYPLSEKQ